MRERDKQMKMAGCLVTAEGSLPFCILACRLNLGRFQNAFMKISRADSVEYLKLCDKYFIGWMRKYKPPAGRKTRLRVAFLMGLPVKNAFALLLTKVTKEGLRPDAARTTNVRADTEKDRLRLRLPARLWLEYDSLEADFYVKQCSTVCSTRQEKNSVWK